MNVTLDNRTNIVNNLNHVWAQQGLHDKSPLDNPLAQLQQKMRSPPGSLAHKKILSTNVTAAINAVGRTNSTSKTRKALNELLGRMVPRSTKNADSIAHRQAMDSAGFSGQNDLLNRSTRIHSQSMKREGGDFRKNHLSLTVECKRPLSFNKTPKMNPSSGQNSPANRM